MDMLNKALIIAINAHKGKFDKGGIDYISHPVYVALNMDSDDEKITALLHDVVEDSSISLEELKAFGFNKQIIEAVNLLTRKKDTDYFDYIKALKNNPLALKVKLADLKHNSDEERLALLGERGQSLSKRYNKAIKYLLEK